jgi:hypothetical protein
MARAIAALTIPVSAGLACVAVACAHASPGPPPGPPPPPPAVGAACGGNLDGALTGAGDTKNLLTCSGTTWQQYLDPYPSSDRWLTTGPELVLHGQGRRNPEIQGGTWMGTPQTTDTTCGAEIVDVLGAGKTSKPQTLAADPGRPLTMDVSDHLFTVRLKGYCLWQKG